jgi:hypothetical protein
VTTRYSQSTDDLLTRDHAAQQQQAWLPLPRRVLTAPETDPRSLAWVNIDTSLFSSGLEIPLKPSRLWELAQEEEGR